MARVSVGVRIGGRGQQGNGCELGEGYCFVIVLEWGVREDPNDRDECELELLIRLM